MKKSLQGGQGPCWVGPQGPSLSLLDSALGTPLLLFSHLQRLKIN